jgi:hypothetical protein
LSDGKKNDFFLFLPRKQKNALTLAIIAQFTFEKISAK